MMLEGEAAEATGVDAPTGDPKLDEGAKRRTAGAVAEVYGHHRTSAWRDMMGPDYAIILRLFAALDPADTQRYREQETTSALTPENALRLAVLRNAIEDLHMSHDNKQATGRHWKKLRREAREWFLRPNDEHIHDFKTIAVDVLRCDPGKILDALKPALDRASIIEADKPKKRCPCGGNYQRRGVIDRATKYQRLQCMRCRHWKGTVIPRGESNGKT